MYTVGMDNKLTIHYFTGFCIYLLCSYYFMLLLFLEYTTSNLKRTGSKIQCCVVHWCLAVKYYAVLCTSVSQLQEEATLSNCLAPSMFVFIHC